MKVGTDGTLLGAWADIPVRTPANASSFVSSSTLRILDIGTGTGLVALMMAQRFSEAQLIGVDIDASAACQARKNALDSPFSERINILCQDVTKMDDEQGFDAIVCNPPYFVDSLTCPKEQRTLARHAVTLSYSSLMRSASKLLKDNGILSIVIPSDSQNDIESAAAFEGLFLTRICLIKTTPNKLPKRNLVEFRKYQQSHVDFQEQILESSPGIRSNWYHNLTKDFYIR